MISLKLLMLGFLHIAVALPAATLEDLLMVDDTMSVGTYVREARAAPPENFHKFYETDGDGEVGYSRKKEGGGKKGYQHFDSYHKKAGDNYELETQDSFGHDEEDDAGAHSHPKERREKYRRAKHNDEDKENQEREKEQRSEKGHEELREGTSDGNGGIEAYGHDPADYVLPEKYTYGSGEEYNF
ncbi:unnamed protein product, partial [Brenthis ino]